MSKYVEFRTTILSTRGALWRDCRGVSALEFAVAFGVLAMIVFGTLQFGRALAAQNQMSHALSRAIRTVHLDPTSSTEEIVALLEDYLGDLDTDLEVTITEVSGTSFMEVAVEFPFHTSLPFSGVSEIDLRVATLAPMVSATQ